MNPHVYKDAVFVSPHKLPGGPGAPGVLAAKRALFANEVPSEPGGGTVFFVTEKDQRYLSARHEREEGGHTGHRGLGQSRFGVPDQGARRRGDDCTRGAIAARDGVRFFDRQRQRRRARIGKRRIPRWDLFLKKHTRVV